MTRIGEKLKAWRESQGLMQREAASRAGIAQGVWSKYETGHAKQPTIAVALRLIAATKGSRHAVKLDDFAGAA